MHALLYLIVSLLAVAVVFFVLGAPFVAALEVIIYAGAIMVLFVFVIMMLNLGKAAAVKERDWLSPGMWVGPAVLAALLLAELIYILVRNVPGTATISGRAAVDVQGSRYYALRTLSPWCRAGFAAITGGIGRRLSPRLAYRVRLAVTF